MGYKRIIITVVIFFLNFIYLSSLEAKKSMKPFDLEGPYMGQIPPGDNPKIFAPGIVTSGFHDRNITFSPDLNEFFFTRTSPVDWHSTIIYFKNVNGKWSKPTLASFISSIKDNVSYPFITPDGKKVYFESKKHIIGSSKKFDGGIWYSSKNKKGEWEVAKPIKIKKRLMKEGFPSVSAKGNIYFWAREKSGADANIYYYKYKNNQYEEAKKLGENINSNNNEFHPFIAPDESYIMFDRLLPGISHDLYISFKRKDGTWTKAINMGDKINAKNCGNMRPYVSPDGKYLFFVSTRGHKKTQNYKLTYSDFMNRISSFGNHSHDIYWVDAKIIQELKLKELN